MNFLMPRTAFAYISRLACVAFLALSLVGCNYLLPTSSADDMKALQGTWTLVTATENGAPQTGDMQWIVEDNVYRIRYNQQLDPTPIKITLDPSRKRIDAFHHETPAGTYGGKLKGIYELSGNSLRVCYDLTGSYYPASFDAGPGSRRVIYEFRRE